MSRKTLLKLWSIYAADTLRFVMLASSAHSWLREESQLLKQELKPVSLPSWPMLSSGIEFKRTSPIVEIDAQ